MVILLIFVNTLTALLTLTSLIGYAVIYTMFLKRRTPQNIIWGGLAGAAPPLLDIPDVVRFDIGGWHGHGYVGDIDLSPETANTFSTTLDWHSDDGRQQLEVTPFYTRVNDYIDAVPAAGTTFVEDQFNVLQYTNQSARLYGVDVSGKLPLASNNLGNWGVNALVNYTNGKNRDSDDELYNVMPLNGTFALTQDVAGWSNSFEVVAVAAKNQVSDVRNEVQTAGYTLYNLRASHQWDQLRVDFGVENLTDKFYYLPTGGTYTGQGTTMGINSIPWGIGVPGIGRSFYTGVNLSF